jgi:hypothetical protein
MKAISYYDVMKKGYDLLREDIDVIYGIDTKDQVESAFHMAGIVDTIVRLEKLFEDTETEEEDN